MTLSKAHSIRFCFYKNPKMTQKIVFFVAVAFVAKLASSATPVFDTITHDGHVLSQSLHGNIWAYVLGDDPFDFTSHCWQNFKSDLATFGDKMKSALQLIEDIMRENLASEYATKPLRNIAKTVKEFPKSFCTLLEEGNTKRALKLQNATQTNITDNARTLAKKFDDLSTQYPSVTKKLHGYWKGLNHTVSDNIEPVKKNLKDCMEDLKNSNF